MHNDYGKPIAWIQTFPRRHCGAATICYLFCVCCVNNAFPDKLTTSKTLAGQLPHTVACLIKNHYTCRANNNTL